MFKYHRDYILYINSLLDDISISILLVSLTLGTVISDQLISMALLPGLRCLLRDMEQVAPDHAAVVASMIREFESGNTGDANSHAERSVTSKSCIKNEC